MEESLPQLILPIKVERSSERLTSLGGLLVLEELARAAGVWAEVDRVLPGPKSGRGYQPREFVQALVWMLHAGGTRLEDLRELGAEREVLGKLGLEAVPDAGTVGCSMTEWLNYHCFKIVLILSLVHIGLAHIHTRHSGRADCSFPSA